MRLKYFLDLNNIKHSLLLRYVTILLLLLVIPILILIWLTEENIADIETQSADQYLSSNLQVVSATIDGVLSTLERSHTSLILNADFTRSLRLLSNYENREPYPDYLQSNAIKKQLGATAVSSNYIYSVYAYGYMAERIFSSKVNWDPRFNRYAAEDSKWLRDYAEHDEALPWTITSGIEDGRKIISSYRRLGGYEIPDYALLSINVDADIISEALRSLSLGQGSYCFMVDQSGSFIDAEGSEENSLYKEIVAAVPQGSAKGLFRFQINTEAHFIFYMLSDYSRFTYIIAAPASGIETISPLVSQMNKIIIGILAAVLLLFLILSYYYLYLPIRFLFRHMHELEKGDLSLRLPESKTYEITYIHRAFNNMVANIQKLINDNYVNRLLSKEAQLKALRSKINEHFLYNTLDTIHWKARMENAPATNRMIFLLADYYRLNLSSGKELIPIEDVISQIRSYLELQKIRMDERLEYEIICSETLYKQPVPQFLFQPIVENAVIHGAKGLERKEILSIKFLDRGELIRFSAEDNGVGFEKEELEKLIETLDGAGLPEGDYFALKLISTQLKSYYGLSCGLNIASEPGKGCRVCFDIPKDSIAGEEGGRL